MAVAQYVYVDDSSDGASCLKTDYTHRRKMAVAQYVYVDDSSDGSSG
jgi:hypothetical protein